MILQIILSAPAITHSSEGATSQKPTVLKTPCQFNTCPVGSPAEGSDPKDRVYTFIIPPAIFKLTGSHAARLNYVNGFGIDAVKYGIQTLAPKFFGGKPDIVISGPNIGATKITPIGGELPAV